MYQEFLFFFFFANVYWINFKIKQNKEGGFSENIIFSLPTVCKFLLSSYFHFYTNHYVHNMKAEKIQQQVMEQRQQASKTKTPEEYAKEQTQSDQPRSGRKRRQWDAYL